MGMGGNEDERKENDQKEEVYLLRDVRESMMRVNVEEELILNNLI